MVIHSLFRVLVHQEERIIAEFEGVAIQVPEQSRKPW